MRSTLTSEQRLPKFIRRSPKFQLVLLIAHFLVIVDVLCCTYPTDCLVPEGLHFFGRGLAARLCVGDGHVHAARVQHHERPVGGKVHAHNGARNLVNISIRAKIGKGTP